ncbi:O-antigen ligase family protein [Thiobacillus sp.]|uniref:O-antigen ligase family protein n=1 Tax=Thiobacillus sp. TaxID=924 RepID=UPI00286E9C88|nr:O-antigen ligase family protein [Thiobacillus sp.]
MKLRIVPAWLLSPALPAAGLLYGLLFCLAIAHLMGWMWPPLATKIFYGALFSWVGVLAWRSRPLPRSPVLADKLFGLFVLGVLVSLLAHGRADSSAMKHLQFVPSLVVLPYIIGRIMTPGDARLLVRVLVWAGPLILLLAIFDYYQSRETMTAGPRWIFFGTDHSPLLISFMLSASLIASTFMLFMQHRTAWRQAALLVVQGISVVSLVFVAARGVLLGAMLGMVFMMFATRGVPVVRRVGFLMYLSAVLIFAFFVLPNPQSELYAKLMTDPNIAYQTSFAEAPNFGADTAVSGATPILGEAACSPFKEGQNSISMRWVLYKEAVAVFLGAPWGGVGAALFGRHSCAGVGGYPHSTILQSFAELGAAGGLLFVGLMAWTMASLLRAGRTKHWMLPLVLGMAVQYLATDQFYGNYLMAAGTYFWVGMTASMQSNSEESPLHGNENA